MCSNLQLRHVKQLVMLPLVMEGEGGLTTVRHQHEETWRNLQRLKTAEGFRRLHKVLQSRRNWWGAEGWTNNFSIFSPGEFPAEGRSARDCWELAAALRPVCSRPLSVTASSTNKWYNFSHPSPMLINGNLDGKSIKFRKDIYYSY